MIDPNKLFQLSGGQKRRKLALCFGALERDIAGIAERGNEYNFSMPRAEYVKALCAVLLKDPKLPEAAASEIAALMNAAPFDQTAERRICNCARNHLLAILGTFPAEWDLVIAPHRGISTSSMPAVDDNAAASDNAAGAQALTNASGISTSSMPAPAADNVTGALVQSRSFYPGVCVYAEDIRSPFNLGSIFRTAEGMGAEKVFISPGCCPPEQSRAVRSGMGCIETMGWTRARLDELPEGLPVFALETGGVPINEFSFPKKGICIIGSEELGISPEALKRADYGRVTIPMIGLKASLNVGVAFGILMQKWIESL